MSWQEELRRLDAELAAGTISSSEHRRRREDILAEVSGAPLVSFSGTTPSHTPDTGTTPPTTEPTSPTPPGSPEEPPQWRAANPAGTEATARTTETRPESSGPSAATAALLSTTRPTTAPSPADQRPTELIRRPDFSAPPPVPPAAGAGAHPDSGEGPRRSGLTWVAISGAVFVALGAVIGGAWWLGQDRSDPPPATAAGNAAPAEDAAAGAHQPTLEDRIPALPGRPSTNDSTLAVDKGSELGLYPEHSARILADHGVNEVIHRASTDGDTGYFLLVIPAPDAERAASLTAELSGLTVSAGFTSVEGFEGGLTGVIDGHRLHGTWYASDNVAVNLWVSQRTPADTERLASLTAEAVATLHRALPPS